MFARTSKLLFLVLSISTISTVIGFLFRQAFSNDRVQYSGLSSETFSSNFHPKFTDNNDFSKVFGILYPACTGILAGKP